MEFTVCEVDEINPERSYKEKSLLDDSDQTDFGIKSDITLTEVANSLIQNDTKTNKEIMSDQEELKQDSIAQGETDSVLLQNDDKYYHTLIEENSINISLKNSTSLSNFSDDESLRHQASSVDNIGLPRENCLRKSVSYNDVRSSSIVSHSFSCVPSHTLSNYDIQSPVSSKCKELKSTHNDERENIFNIKWHIRTHEIKPLERNVMKKYKNSLTKSNTEEIENKVQSFNVDTKLMVNNEKTENLIKKDSNMEQKPSELIKYIRSQQNITSRSTLIDDSKLVKISLPTYPINIMQSNAQFLNKSRSFLNFITEKSTNIMEKALLPQTLTVKYNSVTKSTNNTCNEKKSAKEFSNIISEQNEYTKNYENKTAFAENSDEVLFIDTDQNKHAVMEDSAVDNKHGINTLKSNCIKQVESHSQFSNDNTNEVENSALCTDTNGDSNISFMVPNLEGNNIIQKSLISNAHQKEQEVDSEKLKQSLLQCPEYLILLRNYADLKAKYLKLHERIECLEERNRVLEAENKEEICFAQIETLQKTINTLTLELHAALAAQETLRKEYNSANRERESMVMKYAVSEKQLIDTQRVRECAERKVKEVVKQQELLQSKLREMQGERTRICNILDGKHREVIDLQKEVEKLREDVNMRDVKLKWTQNKLKTEMDLQKETQQKLDKAMIRINEMKEECEQVRKDTQESIRKFQQSEENKAVTLDQQLKEQQARLILERHVTEDKEMLRLQLQKEVETLKNRQQILIEENSTLSLKIQDAEKSRLNYESNLSNLKIIADRRQKEIVELLNKVSEMETLKVQLQHKEQYLASSEAEINHLRLINEELQTDISACCQKEAEMLDFTQKLTDKNVRLQSEFTATEAKMKKLEQEHGPLHEHISELTNKIKILEEKIVQEQKIRTEECEILARHLAEQTKLAQNLAQKLEDSQGENAVLKRKQQITMKEMTRELQQCRKKLETFETSSPYPSLGVVSRSGSNISLNTGDTLNGALSDNNIYGDQGIQSMEPSKQMLIDRIIKLQEINAKKAEKLDFFEEHTRTLVEELQKKTRIIQNYILHESTGVMGNNERDKYKAELAKHGGIMASVYNQRVSDDNMTLELSLEINQKLQAVLEDALFKNITLKDNIDTLGEEIARLTIQNQQKKN